MNTTKILVGILVALFGLFLGAQSASAITLADLPAVSFDEDSSSSTLDLDTYVSGATGTVTYTYSGNTNIFVSIGTDGIVTFTAKANWNGVENIVFKATDTLGSTQDTVVTTVNAVNDAPTTTLGNLKAYQDVAYTYEVKTVATDIDGDTLDYTASTSWTTFKMDSTGKISFTPTVDDIGKHSVTITIKDTKSATAIKTIDFIVTEATDDGSLVISEVEIDDETGDSDETLPGDVIEADFDITNKLTAIDFEDIEVKAWIEDNTGDRVSDRIESKTFDLEADEDESLVLKIRTPLDAEDGTYTLVIRAQGEDESGNTKTNLYFEDFTIERKGHDLMIDTITLNPAEAAPGGSLEFAVHVYNIGTDDEDDVKVRVRNSELGIDKATEAFEVEESGSDADVVKRIIVDVPATAKAGDYQFDVVVTYNEGSGSESMLIPVKVAGESVAPVTEATIEVANTLASARPGETVKFAVTVKNTEATTADFELTISGVSNWAIASIEPSTATLAAGSEMPMFVYLTPKEGTSGDYTANIAVMSGDTTLATKTLTVNVLAAKTQISAISDTLGSVGISDTNTLVFAGLVVLLAAIAIGLFVARRGKKVEVYGKGR